MAWRFLNIWLQKGDIPGFQGRGAPFLEESPA